MVRIQRGWREREAADKEQRARYRKARNAELRALVRKLKDKPCHDCKQRYPYYVMDFDHLPDRPMKRWGISELLHGNGSLKRLLREVDKCDVVCANCHRERTHRRKQAPTNDFEPVMPTEETVGWF